MESQSQTQTSLLHYFKCHSAPYNTTSLSPFLYALNSTTNLESLTPPQTASWLSREHYGALNHAKNFNAAPTET